jgi:hypothetical protein
MQEIQRVITLIRSGSSNPDHHEGQRQIEEAIGLLKGIQVAGQWQPMETAPKDGDDVLLGHWHVGIFTARFIDGKWRSSWGGQEIHCIEKCRWQYLPGLLPESEWFAERTENHTLVASEKALRNAFGEDVIDEARDEQAFQHKAAHEAVGRAFGFI